MHERPPAILPSLLACDLANLAAEANRVAPTKADHVSTISIWFFFCVPLFLLSYSKTRNEAVHRWDALSWT